MELPQIIISAILLIIFIALLRLIYIFLIEWGGFILIIGLAILGTGIYWLAFVEGAKAGGIIGIILGTVITTFWLGSLIEEMFK